MPLKQQLRALANYQIPRLSSIAFAFFIITRLVAIFFSLPCISDVNYYLDIFSHLYFPLSPYSQFDLEYPPFSLLPIYLAGLLTPTPNFTSYFLSFASLMFACDALCLHVCKTYCRKRLRLNDYEISYMTLLYALFGLLSFRLLYHRLDLVMSLFFALSLLFFRAKEKRFRLDFFLNFFLGFFYKIVSIVSIPLACIFKASNQSKNLRSFIKKTAIYAIVFASILFFGIKFFEIISNHNFARNMLYHQNRGIQVESSFAIFFALQNFLFDQPLPISSGFGAFNLDAPHFLEIIAKNLGHLVLLGFYFTVFVILARKKIAEEKIKISEDFFLEGTLSSILLFLAFQRVLSPQFFIWLIPIFAIFLAKNRSFSTLLATSFLFFLTFVIFSIDYMALIDNQSILLITALFLRNLLLLAFASIFTWKFLKKLQQNDIR